MFGIIIINISKLSIFDKEVIAASSDFKDEKEEIIDMPPEITLNGDKLVKVFNIDEYQELGISAIDDIDGDISELVQANLIKYDDNNYQIEYFVKDSAGNLTEVTRDIKVIKGIVCLTFDDGPSLEITPYILDILNEKGVKATFFLNAYDEERRALVEREHNEEHAIALHGYSHEYSRIYTGLDTLMDNFYRLENLIYETTGTDSKIIRFPGGTSNTISRRYCRGIMSAAAQRVSDEGYIYVDWNVDSDDAGSARTPEKVFQNVTSGLIPGRTNVILMHDSSAKKATLGALASIIDYCIENGYDIQTITPETATVHHGAQN